MLEALEPKEWLQLNAKLQSKKNALRKALKERGILQRGAENTYDRYKYFSEAQYKELFTDLFSTNGLELKFDEIDYSTFEGSEKQANGRMPRLQFSLFDVETGFYETTVITGEGIDKGDKAGYKAYTGALKYYLATTFMVATGNDPEKSSPDNRMNKQNGDNRKATAAQISVIANAYKGDNLTKLLEKNKISSLDELPASKAADLIIKLNEKARGREQPQ